MKKINTALCSFGMSGVLFHAPFIEVHSGFNFYAVWERTKNLAKGKYPSVVIFRSLEEMLADENIELVIVNTPSTTHFDIAKKVILAGKHLIVEKPFTSTVEEANMLIELADKKNVKLSVYQNRRYDGDFKTVQKILRENLLGDIVEAEIHFNRYRPELSNKVHKEIPTAAVGSLYDLGSHMVDQALQLFGMPVALFSDITSFRPGSKVTDYFDIKLIYPTHRVSLKSSYYVREILPGYIINGKKGSFIKSKTDVQENELLMGKVPGKVDWGMEPEMDYGLLHTEKDGEIIRIYIPSLKGNYLDFYEEMFNAIREEKPVPVSAADGMNVIKIIEAAIKSNEERKVIDF